MRPTWPSTHRQLPRDWPLVVNPQEPTSAGLKRGLRYQHSPDMHSAQRPQRTIGDGPLAFMSTTFPRPITNSVKRSHSHETRPATALPLSIDTYSLKDLVPAPP